MVRLAHYALMLTLLLIGGLSAHGQGRRDLASNVGKIDSTLFEQFLRADSIDGEAVMLQKHENIVLDIEGNAILEGRHTIKITSKAGMSYADVILPVATLKNAQVDFKGYVIQLDSTSKVIQKDSVNRKEVLKEQIINNSYMAITAPMPNVKPGCIIDYYFNISIPYNTLKHDYMIQEFIPVLEASIYHYSFTEVKSSYKTYKPFTNIENLFYTDFGRYCIKYEINDLAAFKAENFITIPEDYLTQVSFLRNFDGTTLNSWTDWRRETMIDTPLRSLIDSRTGKRASTLIASNAAAKEKMLAIYNYCKATLKITPNKNEDLSDFTIAKVLATKEASVDVGNLTLIGLLRAANIKAYPLLSSTRGNGQVNKNFPPSGTYFNKILALAIIEQDTFIMNLSGKYYPPNVLPKAYLNGEGLMLSEKAGEPFVEEVNDGWVTLLGKGSEEVNSKLTLTLDPQAELSNIEENLFFRGFPAGYLNSRLDRDIAIEEAFNKVASRTIEYEQKDIKVKRYAKYCDSVLLTLNGSNSSLATFTETNIYLTLPLASTFQSNPFNSQHRKHEVNIGYTIKEQYEAKVILPDGYVVESMPKDITLELKNNGGFIKIAFLNNEKEVLVKLERQLKRPVYKASEYSTLFYVMEQLQAYSKKAIVFKKL